jgi:hypothetical protein
MRSRLVLSICTLAFLAACSSSSGDTSSSDEAADSSTGSGDEIDTSGS